MKKLLSIILIIFSIIFGVIGAEEEAPVIPMIPILPAFPSNMEADGEIMRKPLETKTVILGMEVEVVIPLEIISDIEIQAMVIDDQEIEVPFEIEINKEPDKRYR